MSTQNIKKVNTHLQEFQNDGMNVPVIFHTSEDLLPNDATFDQLENLAKDERLFHHIAAMSDVHPKKGRKNPTGTAIATKNILLPQINDTAPNCGMRLIKTNLTIENTTEKQIDAIFKELVNVIPTKKYIGTPIPYNLSLEVARLGIEPLLKHFKTRTKNEIENTFSNGNLFKNDPATVRDILDAVPSLFFHIGKYRLGILGAAGNHFLDLMKITEIRDKDIAEKFGIKEGQYIFLLHTGSGLLGQYASYMYTPKKKEHLSQQIILKLGTFFFNSQKKKIYSKIAKQIEEYKNKEEFIGYKDNSLEGKMFFTAHRAAANFGFANRTVLTHHLDNAIEKVLGKSAELDLLYDNTHISIEKERHFNEDIWIHRNGAVRANGPSRMNGHPLFSKTGEPVFIPSSMSTPAYLAVGIDKNETTFFSAGHGTGRRKEANTNIPHNKEELMEKIAKNNVKLYNAKSKGVIQQDSAYYKDIEEVISGMEENKVVNIVAKMQPVAVLMY
ncbi:MAG: hypothetical protein ACD_11C00020G0003 [uncultured bacterium]|nr:MAG: hypothetical protein ACD_11C00020G0003 [uncultured bacterium]HBR71288.1 hypothetical protein [Candidatus Moranbacteria bacterium]